MRLELAQTFAVGSAHPTVILYLITLDYLDGAALTIEYCSISSYLNSSSRFTTSPPEL